MARPSRRNRGMEIGVLLLLAELLNVGIGHIPPVTLITIIGQALLYVGIIRAPWDRWDVCISADKVLSAREYSRLFISTVEHGDDLHLYYNMISFLVKGRSLEKRYGSTNFAFLLFILAFLTSIGYVALGKGCAVMMDDPYYMKVCAIGFSGVIFALKVVTSREAPPGNSSVMGIRVSTHSAAWAELVLIHLLVPGSSFMGHLAGILAGMLYARTPVGTCIDSIITSISGEPMVHHPSFYNNNDPVFRAYYDDNGM